MIVCVYRMCILIGLTPCGQRCPESKWSSAVGRWKRRWSPFCPIRDYGPSSSEVMNANWARYFLLSTYRRTGRVSFGGGGGGLKSLARIFCPLLAPKSSGFARILPNFLPENGYLNFLHSLAPWAVRLYGYQQIVHAWEWDDLLIWYLTRKEKRMKFTYTAVLFLNTERTRFENHTSTCTISFRDKKKTHHETYLYDAWLVG